MAVGRPTVMTPEIIGKLEEAFSMGCTDLEACYFADISKDALYDYQGKNKDFTERKEKLKERPIFLARQSVLKGLEGDHNLALKFLERRKKDEFSTSADVNLGGQANNPIKTTTATDAEILAQYLKGKE